MDLNRSKALVDLKVLSMSLLKNVNHNWSNLLLLFMVKNFNHMYFLCAVKLENKERLNKL